MKFGVIAIGRNEGQRLKTCLASLSAASAIVYVDSGSTDDSVILASNAGADIVNLDMTRPFTAARARNTGFRRLRQIDKTIEYVQFIDGDCELIASWPKQALAFLDQNPVTAAVTGRRRERFPARSVYNWLCDLEWNTPPGETRSFGGDVMIRAIALDQVSGYREDMIAGEEPELCVRLRGANWKIWRLDAEMTLHDAAMTRFSQWWRRSLRSGYAFGLGSSLHGRAPEYHKVRETRRAWLWGVWLPLAGIVSPIVFGPWGALLWCLYPLQILRLVFKRQGPLADRLKIAFFQTLARFPEGVGEIMCLRDRVFSRKRRLIEYK
jgi:glycosyltransferase involved in cell wall biosynthesis